VGALRKRREKKKEKKRDEYLERYKLGGISDDDLAIVESIANDLRGQGLIKAGMALSFASAAEQAKVGYLSALVSQNWIIIRKLNQLLDRMEG
jgi:hypothetical protein